MAVIIPNAGDTTSGNKYESLDQAEPDALDFEILGNSFSGVLSGCVVTSNASPNNVAVSEGTIILDGAPYSVTANLTLALPAAPSDNRFDLVVARVTGGIASLSVVSGDDSGTNPSFPRSVNLITGAGSPTTNVDFSTDVVLASLYRSGSSSVTSSRIVDKRAVRNAGVMFHGSGAPTVADGEGAGHWYFDPGSLDGTNSGVYIKRTDSTWSNLALNVGAHFPIGGVFAWPTNAPAPEGCLAASGQGVATNSYPALFGVYGYEFGGSGGTFNLPDLNDEYSLKGTTGTPGGTIGQDSYTLTLQQMPVHQHGTTHTHTHSHRHGISHNHGSAYTSYSGSHVHPMNQIGGDYGVVAIYNPSKGYFGTLEIATSTTSNRHVMAVKEFPDQFYKINTTQNGEPNTHTHLLDLPNFSGNSGSPDITTTSAPNNTLTEVAGNSDYISNLSKHQYVTWMIRASLGDDPSYTGGSPAFEAAYEEVFVVELYAEGESVAADVSLGTSFRMPWPGTITNVRAAVGIASDTGPILIDVNEDPTGTLLSTKLTIDQDELTSTTAATPPVISDTILADDALISFDVDNGGANAEGPLTVTLYITRSS